MSEPTNILALLLSSFKALEIEVAELRCKVAELRDEVQDMREELADAEANTICLALEAGYGALDEEDPDEFWVGGTDGPDD